MAKHKIVVLPDGTGAEVPEDHEWLAMERSEEWFSYELYPEPNEDADVWATDGAYDHVWGLSGPFEPGHWTTQLYYIGDEGND